MSHHRSTPRDVRFLGNERELGFISVPADHERYLWHAGQGGHINNLVYERESETLYRSQS